MQENQNPFLIDLLEHPNELYDFKDDKLLTYPFHNRFSKAFVLETSQDDYQNITFRSAGLIDRKELIWYDAPSGVQYCDQAAGIEFRYISDRIKEMEGRLQEVLLERILKGKGIKKVSCKIEDRDIKDIYIRICKGDTFEKISFQRKLIPDSQSYYIEYCHANLMMRYLENPEQFIEEWLKKKEYEQNEQLIYEAKKELLIQQEYKNLQGKKNHPIWQKVAMLNALPKDAQNVNVTFSFGSGQISHSIPVRILQDLKGEIVTYHMPEKIMQIRDVMFPKEKGKEISQSAIIKVSSKRKVVYDKEQFLKEKVQEKNK